MDAWPTSQRRGVPSSVTSEAKGNHSASEKMAAPGHWASAPQDALCSTQHRVAEQNFSQPCSSNMANVSNYAIEDQRGPSASVLALYKPCSMKEGAPIISDIKFTASLIRRELQI